MSNHEEHKWVTAYLLGCNPDNSHKYLQCEKCGLRFQSSFKEPYYHYKMKVYKDIPSCNEIKMQEALS